jgi:AcrR family transcriptional regulator
MGVLEREGITLQRVAHALGITTTALYRYFPSKDPLLAALQRDAVTELHEALKATLAGVEPRLTTQEPRVSALARLLRSPPSGAPWMTDGCGSVWGELAHDYVVAARS